MILGCLFIFESEVPSVRRVEFVHRAYWKLKLAESPGGISLHFIYKGCSSTLLPGDVCAGDKGGSWGQ